MIFFPPGEKYEFFPDFFPKKVLLIFLCEPKTIHFLLFFLFPSFSPFSFPCFSFFLLFLSLFPLFPSLFFFLLRLVIIFSPTPKKLRKGNRKIYTPVFSGIKSGKKMMEGPSSHCSLFDYADAALSLTCPPD